MQKNRDEQVLFVEIDAVPPQMVWAVGPLIHGPSTEFAAHYGQEVPDCPAYVQKAYEQRWPRADSRVGRQMRAKGW